MRRSLVFLFLVLICPSLTYAQTSPPYDTDFQVWNELNVNIPLDKKKLWILQIVGVSRVGNNLQTFTDERIGVNILRKINKHLTLGGGYVYRISNPTFRLQRFESRVVGNATITIPLGKKTTLINRNLLLYQSLYSRPDTSLYRPRLWLTREVKISKTKISPFVSFENFWDFRMDAFARNRIQAGVTRKFNKKLTADIYYLRQNEGGNSLRRGTLNAIGANWKVNL